MARTFNMSQFKSQIRQAQHKAERQLIILVSKL